MSKTNSDLALRDAEATEAENAAWDAEIDGRYGWMSGNGSLYFECGRGWKYLLEDMLRRIDLSLNSPEKRAEFRLAQVKEKYGTLSVYFDGGDASTQAHVRVAEELSETTCEVCSRPGRMRNSGGWCSVRCDECFESKHGGAE